MFFTANEPMSEMTNIKPLVLPPDSFYEYLYVAPPFTTSNGWELLLLNLGYYPNTDDGTPEGGILTHNFVDQKFIPYIVLYNKYTGIMRVFLAYGKNQSPDGAIDGVMITLTFFSPALGQDEVSGILRLVKGRDNFLDQPTSTVNTTAVAKNPGVEHKWYSADFQLAYDPCTCEYPTKLALIFDFFSETEFRLVGNSLSSNDIPMSEAEELINNDFLGNFELDEGGDIENGYIIYNNLSLLIDDFIAKTDQYIIDYQNYEEQLKRFEREKAIMEAFKMIILQGAGAAFAGPAGFNIGAAAAQGFPFAIAFVDHAKDLKDADGNLSYFKLNSESKKLLGHTVNMLTTESSNEPVPPTKPIQPSVSYSQMSFKGKLSDEMKVGTIDFPTPGTFDYTIPVTSSISPITGLTDFNYPLEYKYPIYNEVLGVFALTNTPSINVFNNAINISCESVNIQNPPGSVFEDPQDVYYTNLFQIQLNDALNYSINPKLDIINHSIDVALVVEGYFVQTQNQVFNPDERVLNHLVNLQTYDTALYSFPSHHHGDGIVNSTAYKIETPFFPIDAIRSVVGSVSVGVNNSLFNSYVTSALESYAINTLGLSLNGTTLSEIFTEAEACEIIAKKMGFKFVVTSVQLKLNVNVLYNGINSANQPLDYFYSFTYDLPISDDNVNYYSSPIIDNIEGSESDFTQFPYYVIGLPR